jgi:hypothetical protein
MTVGINSMRKRPSIHKWIMYAAAKRVIP